LNAPLPTKVFKQKKCKQCGEVFVPTRPIQPVCGYECSIKFALKHAETSEQRRLKESRKAYRERKLAAKTLSQWKAETQLWFNKFIKLRDKAAGHSCISSGRPLDWSGNAVDAGHYRSVGSAPHLRFDENNVHAQSKHDNRYKSGNAVDYRIGLIRRIGLAAVEALEADQTPRHYTIPELIEKKRYYQLKCKQLTKGD
jgi:hypothetical protein